MTDAPSLVAQACALAKAGRTADAAAVIVRLLHEEFGLTANGLTINSDMYSLNSLNGTFVASGEALFFKFHQEENEGAMAGEYYRARLLDEAGLPVDLPMYAATEPGRQILVYRRRTDARFADVLRALDETAPGGRLPGSLSPGAGKTALAAESALNAQLMQVYARTLHPITPEQSAAEPIHRLFHQRLVTPGHPGRLGGRFASFYQDKAFALPGLRAGWNELKDLTFVVNGIGYDRTLGQLFDEAFIRLRPDRLAGSGGVTAHGDAHNANVWLEQLSPTPGTSLAAGGQLPEGVGLAANKVSMSAARLVMFDPAFAGTDIPALLAEVKATFHNIFAHPWWLYEPAVAASRYQVVVRQDRRTLYIEHDWHPGAVRLAVLQLKAGEVWQPLLALLKTRDLLPSDWRRVVKLALFLCPTLVMNLRAGAEDGSHNPVSSAIGLATAVAMGAEPDKPDVLSAMLDEVTPLG